MKVLFPDNTIRNFNCDSDFKDKGKIREITKPCPFCGKFDTIYINDNHFGGDRVIRCERCNVFIINKYKENYDDIIKRWNNR
jgi:phage FluMu protein Com